MTVLITTARRIFVININDFLIPINPLRTAILKKFLRRYFFLRLVQTNGKSCTGIVPRFKSILLMAQLRITI